MGRPRVAAPRARNLLSPADPAGARHACAVGHALGASREPPPTARADAEHIRAREGLR